MVVLVIKFENVERYTGIYIDVYVHILCITKGTICCQIYII
jgi:hypothetical protein